MKVYNILSGSFLFLALMFCSNHDTPEVKDENRFPSCGELELIEMERPESSFSIGDTLKAVVRNTCKSCEQAVYTGLLAYSGQDTLAIDIEGFAGNITPDNGQIREYQLRVLKEFNLRDVTRVEIAGICKSIVLEF